jgi:hypothetical protein
VFIGGTGDFDKYLVTLAAEQLKEFENRVTITILTDLPLDETLRRVANLPRIRSYCSRPFLRMCWRVICSARRDHAGFRSRECSGLRIPRSIHRRGIVGGTSTVSRAHGSQTAEIALKICVEKAPQTFR